MFKRLILFILAVLALAIPAAAQTDGTSNTIMFSEAMVNDAIARRLAATGRDVSASADLKEGEVDVKLSGTGPRGQTFDLTVVLVPSVTDAGQILWTPADLVLTDAQGNPITSQNASNFAVTFEDVMISSFQAAMRDQMDNAPHRPRVTSVTVTEDAIIVVIDSRTQPAADGVAAPPGGDSTLPPNVTRNDDGTLSIHMNQGTVNDALARIAARRDAIDAMTVEMTDGHLLFSITAPAACDGQPITADVVWQPDASGSGGQPAVESLSCNGQTLTGPRANGIIGILIGLLVDFGNLQVRTATLVDVQIVPGEMIFTVQPPARQAGS